MAVPRAKCPVWREWGHRDAKALIEWLGYYDKAFELPLKTGGSTDMPRFGF